MLDHELQRVRQKYESEVQKLQTRLRQYKEIQATRDSELAKLKKAIRKIEKREGKRREVIPMPKMERAGSGKNPPTPRMHRAAGGTPGDGDDDDDDDDDDDEGSHRRRK